MKPCPFCGSTMVMPSDPGPPGGHGIPPYPYMQCCYCGATGPSERSLSKAEESWNKRADLEEES